MDGAQDVDVAARLRTISREGPRETSPDARSGDPTTTGSAGHELRQRALTSALDAYTAVHGHPVGAEHVEARAGGTAVRWATRTRVAVTATVALALVVLAVVGRVWLQVPSVGLGGAPDGAVPGALAASSEPDRSDGPTHEPGTTSPGTAVPEAVVRETVVPEAVVHVVGAVHEPGLVTLAAGSRVADALEAAGGPTPTADLTTVNLARPVVDGEQVHVPRRGEQPPAGAGTPVAGGGPSGSGPAKVDLNRADAASLETLPGIGPVLAERIVAWRAEHGHFTTVEELGEVSGVGPKVLDGLRDHVTVG